MTTVTQKAHYEIPLVKINTYKDYILSFFFGLLLPLSFAPFHLPGFACISLAFLYSQLERSSKALCLSLFFGLGYFGLGISWLYVSIHLYGHLHAFLSGLITLILIFYQSLYIVLAAFIFRYLAKSSPKWLKGLLFAAIWVLVEYCRATFLNGFPWLLIGTGQFDAPTGILLPILGIYGLSFITAYAATILVKIVQVRKSGQKTPRSKVLFFLALMLFPLLFKKHQWVQTEAKPLSVAIIQEDLSMRDKWDEALFWELLSRYKSHAEALLGTDLIVMPESAIPVPVHYVQDTLTDLHEKALLKNSAILLGIPQTSARHEEAYYNSLLGLGTAKGSYFKQQRVPIGEYFPELLKPLLNYFAIENANTVAGPVNQPLIKVENRPIASLICYELAYPLLLRKQLPDAQFIVSISDDGWFGHSLALYQHMQMAQVISALTGRYQVMANNDGLSAILDSSGQIVANLPAFEAGVLKSNLYASKGLTPWSIVGDIPILSLCLIISLFCFLLKNLSDFPLVQSIKRRYPYQPE